MMLRLPTVERAELTKSEIGVLRLAALGYTDAEIADRLGLKHETARTHMTHIRRKLGVSNRTQVALYAVVAGVVSHGEVVAALAAAIGSGNPAARAAADRERDQVQQRQWRAVHPEKPRQYARESYHRKKGSEHETAP
jgi:DNA-binding CsgD family transcriptional regulator